MTRDPALETFARALIAAFRARPRGDASAASIERIAAALGTAAPREAERGARLPVCEHAGEALAVRTGAEDLDALIAAFRRVEPDLRWARRESFDESASANFSEGHANAMILGPGGLESRDDLWLGVSLLAPHVRYTDHAHAPEETYLVLSEGEFRQGEGEWFSPGVGGGFYNIPWIRHAMRSGDRPLFAFWALWAGSVDSEA